MQHPPISDGSSWVKPDWATAAQLTNRLTLEIAKADPLHPQLANLLVVYRDTISDDVLFVHGDEPDSYYLIHFTYAAKPTAKYRLLTRDETAAVVAKT